MSNLDLWGKVRVVPPEALKAIMGGRLKGKSDINPVWRLKMLTEQFGLCGVGWKYAITKQWLETGGKEEIAAFVNIDLCIKVDGVWSDPIPGTGGSSFVAKESSGPYTSDECFKMALTDAISVSCKALGFAADVYWNSDSTKYNKPQSLKDETPKQQVQKSIEQKLTDAGPVNWKGFWANTAKLGFTEEEVHGIAGVDSIKEWSRDKATELLNKLKTMKQGAK